jgi:Protein of unknown function (DUF3060)
MNLRSANRIVVLFCLLVYTAAMSGPVEAKGKNVTIDKKDQTSTIECTGNAVTVSGEDNMITLKGECSKLIVKGRDINITAATVKEVIVSGTDINVMVANVAKINALGNDINILWGSGIGGKAPKITKKKENDINIVHTGK